MSRGKFYVLLILCFCLSKSFSQHRSYRTSTDVSSIGAGVGFDYGGFGGNALFYPQENFGFFVGGGYAVAGMAYNAGLKFRLTSLSPVIQPNASVMYGHNAAVSTTNGAQSKLFYGASFGAGVDIRLVSSDNYFSLGIIVPGDTSEAKEYVHSLNGQGVSFNSASLPVGFSIGYRFVIQNNDY